MTKDLYRAEFIKHVAAGDDDDMARMRIIEQGCPVALAVEIEREEGDGDGSDLDDEEGEGL